MAADVGSQHRHTERRRSSVPHTPLHRPHAPDHDVASDTQVRDVLELSILRFDESLAAVESAIVGLLAVDGGSCQLSNGASPPRGSWESGELLATLQEGDMLLRTLLTHHAVALASPEAVKITAAYAAAHSSAAAVVHSPVAAATAHMDDGPVNVQQVSSVGATPAEPLDTIANRHATVHTTNGISANSWDPEPEAGMLRRELQVAKAALEEHVRSAEYAQSSIEQLKMTVETQAELIASLRDAVRDKSELLETQRSAVAERNLLQARCDVLEADAADNEIIIAELEAERDSLRVSAAEARASIEDEMQGEVIALKKELADALADKPLWDQLQASWETANSRLEEEKQRCAALEAELNGKERAEASFRARRRAELKAIADKEDQLHVALQSIQQIQN